MMKKLSFVIAIAIIGLSSCVKLDSFMFSNLTITEYKLDGFVDDIDFQLDDTYKIDESKIQLFTLESGENKDLIYAIYIGDQSRIATDTVIMYCHGNYGHMDFYWQRAKTLANIGSKNRYGVLMVDYKGFGMSEGKPTEGGLVEDVNAGLAWLKEKGLTSDRLVIYGFSLGSYPATYLSSKKDGNLIPSKLILEAPFASTRVMVNDASRLSMSNNYFTTTDYENADLIKDVQQPFLWIHGTNDDFLNMETHGQVVYDNYVGTYSQAIIVVGAGHSSVPQLIYDSNYTSNTDGTPVTIDIVNYSGYLLDFITR